MVPPPLFSMCVCCDNGEDEGRRKITEKWAVRERGKTQGFPPTPTAPWI